MRPICIILENFFVCCRLFQTRWNLFVMLRRQASFLVRQCLGHFTKSARSVLWTTVARVKTPQLCRIHSYTDIHNATSKWGFIVWVWKKKKHRWIRGFSSLCSVSLWKLTFRPALSIYLFNRWRPFFQFVLSCCKIYCLDMPPTDVSISAQQLWDVLVTCNIFVRSRPSLRSPLPFKTAIPCRLAICQS